MNNYIKEHNGIFAVLFTLLLVWGVAGTLIAIGLWLDMQNYQISCYLPIIIKNTNPEEELLAGYIINFTLDTTNLSFQDCKDKIRIVYNDSIVIERDNMTIIGCGMNDTQIWFRLLANIEASAKDENYAIYYGR
jgi:hypothetical protein